MSEKEVGAETRAFSFATRAVRCLAMCYSALNSDCRAPIYTGL